MLTGPRSFDDDDGQSLEFGEANEAYLNQFYSSNQLCDDVINFRGPVVGR